MSIQIQQAQPAQAPAISALALRAKKVWGYSAEFIRQCTPELTYSAAQLTARVWFFAVAYQSADQQHAINGFYALGLAEPQHIGLEALFVEPAVIGQGIGKSLFRHAVNHARQRGAKDLLIQADPNAADFYQALGAQIIGERPSESIAGRMLPLLIYPLA